LLENTKGQVKWQTANGKVQMASYLPFAIRYVGGAYVPTLFVGMYAPLG
jgi:hypothetical protein